MTKTYQAIAWGSNDRVGSLIRSTVAEAIQDSDSEFGLPISIVVREESEPLTSGGLVYNGRVMAVRGSNGKWSRF